MSIAELIASDPKLTEDEAAAFLGIKPQTLAVWRCNRRYDLKYIKCGRLVRYPMSELRKFVERRTVGAAAAE